MEPLGIPGEYYYQSKECFYWCAVSKAWIRFSQKNQIVAIACYNKLGRKRISIKNCACPKRCVMSPRQTSLISGSQFIKCAQLILKSMKSLQDNGCEAGEFTTQHIHINDYLWVSLLPKLEHNLTDALVEKDDVTNDSDRFPTPPGLILADEDAIMHKNLADVVHLWAFGRVSNFDYLMYLNHLAGRRMGDARCHPIFPWVIDFTSPSGAWRDLAKSKFRMNKGDRQLDMTYEVSIFHPLKDSMDDEVGPSSLDNLADVVHLWAFGRVSNFDYLMYLNHLAGRRMGDARCHPIFPWHPHHVTELLSEITYYVYKARRMPKSVLCKHVRSNWVPGEYPSSIQRMFEWSPDECIPEFFMDPDIFKSIHEDLGDLEIPSWSSCPEDLIDKHRQALESNHVSEMLHHWIDLTFGYKLSGSAAVKAKNVCLSLVDDHSHLTRSGVVQLFTVPHPPKVMQSAYFGPNPPAKAIKHHSRRKRHENHRSLSGHESLESDWEESSNDGAENNAVAFADQVSVEDMIMMPKDYPPLQALLQLESLYDFINKLLIPRSHHCPHQQQFINPNSIVSSFKARNMCNLSCVILEIFLPLKFRCLQDTCPDGRLQVAEEIVRKEKYLVPLCVKGLVENILNAESREEGLKIHSGGKFELGLPAFSPLLLLQPIISPLIFPEYFPMVYKLIKNFEEVEEVLFELKLMSLNAKACKEMEDKIMELQIKTLAADLDDLLPELLSPGMQEAMELLWPVIDRVFKDKRRRVMAAWHLVDTVGQAVGPKKTAKHLLKPVVDIFDNEDDCVTMKHMKLFHHSFLLQLCVRFGTKRFLAHFVTCLVEAVGGNKEFDDEESNFHTKRHNRHLHPRNTAEPQKLPDEPEEVFSMDEEVHDQSPAKPDGNEGDIYGDPAEIRYRKLKGRAASGLASQLSCSVPESSFMNEGHFKGLKDTVERAAKKKNQVGLNISDVAAGSTVWLAERVGPVLTAKYVTRNLLRMLSLCYLDEDSLVNLNHNCPPTSISQNFQSNDTYLGAAFSGRSVRGDICAKKVLDCLSSISSLYGEHFIIRQYLPHAAELLFSSQRKLSPSLEAGSIGCLSLLHHILPYLRDSTLMEHLQSRILNGVLYPVLQMVTSTRLQFPHGYLGRAVMTWKALDVLFLISSRIGMEMTKKYMTSCLNKFFSGFDVAFSPTGKVDLDSSVFHLEAMPGTSLEESGYFDITKEASGYVVSGLVHLEKLQASPCEEACEPSGSSPKADVKMLEEIAGCFTQEMAHLSYIAFCHLSGNLHLERHVRNEALVRQLCEDFEKYAVVNPRRKQPKDVAHVSTVDAAQQTAVVGNRICIESDVKDGPGDHEQSDWEPPPDDRLRKRMESSHRHLKGNWLAYWENQVGRSEKDNELDLKQIALQSFVGHTASIRQVYVMDNENSALSSSKDKTVKLWSIRNQGDGNAQVTPRWSYNEHKKGVNGLAYLDRIRRVISCDSTSLHIWDPFLGAIVCQVDAGSGSEAPQGVGGGGGGKNPPLTAIAVAQPATVVAATTDGILRMFDARCCAFAQTYKVSPFSAGMIRCICVSGDERHVCVGHSTGAMSLLDLRTGSLISAWKGHEQEVLQVVACGLKYFVTSSMDQSLAVWSCDDAKLRFNLRSYQEPVQCLAVTGQQIISGTTGNRLGIHESVDPSAACSSARLRSDVCKGTLTALAVLPLNGIFLVGTESGESSIDEVNAFKKRIMCGIFCVISAKNPDDVRVSFEIIDVWESLLESRGPDSKGSQDIDAGCCCLKMAGYVLWQQGQKMTSQPLLDESGNALLWNGNVFGGLEIPPGHSDTEAILQGLSNAENIPAFFQKLEGPGSLIYYDNRSKRLWFRRDCIGRRSLLIAQVRDPEDCVHFVISSVMPSADTLSKQDLDIIFCEELPAGLTCALDLTVIPCSLENLQVTVFPDSIDNAEPPRVPGVQWKSEIPGVNRSLLDFLNREVPVRNLKVDAALDSPAAAVLKSLCVGIEALASEFLDVLENAVRVRLLQTWHLETSLTERRHTVAVLPEGASIDLLNISFSKSGDADGFSLAPDRKTGRQAFAVLCDVYPEREWNFLELNVTGDELKRMRKTRIRDLIHPRLTVLDDSLGCALWFAASGKGRKMSSDPSKSCETYECPARVLLLGMGADEQLGGYIQHRRKAAEKLHQDTDGRFRAINDEIALQLSRIGSRNLGRDDRVVSDHGCEARYPYLDEKVIPPGHSDTEAILQGLSNAENIPAFFQKLEGPGSLIYYDNRSKRLWFRRDCIGRRSLLIAQVRDPEDCVHFVISSVMPSADTLSKQDLDIIFCEELPAGLTCALDLTVIPCSLENLQVTVFPDSIDNAEPPRVPGVQWKSEIPGVNRSLLDFLNREVPVRNLKVDAALDSPAAAVLKSLCVGIEALASEFLDVLENAVRVRLLQTTVDLCRNCLQAGKTPGTCRHCRIGILFSGGLDSSVIAAVCHRILPEGAPIDLLNISFSKSGDADGFSLAPDRKTGRQAFAVLCDVYPEREWNFIELNVTGDELKRMRKTRIRDLIHPRLTVLDDSLGCALWFAASGKGRKMSSDPSKSCETYECPARVLLLGMGADEQLGGYIQHRRKAAEKLHQDTDGRFHAINDEIALQLSRIGSRNLGRDDRVVSDHGCEARYPYLDEKVVVNLAVEFVDLDIPIETENMRGALAKM
ncbi:unnamed protein product [Notodromas monacha]|uniref:WD repeat-containing protein 81 n=1 Tax=Notodromas monacha TaxID=399045 RepID=A0A7R9GG88_9CRUS|nr:unnamed protein product [Notodromas monacha]CAG0920124.1 unnamed protein product [Notodromas monacha]